MNKLAQISLAALISLASESCASSKYCTSIDLENKRRLETCVLYDNNGKPSYSLSTLFNGWNLPVVNTYDYGLDGPDEVIRFEYDIHRNVKSKTKIYDIDK